MPDIHVETTVLSVSVCVDGVFRGGGPRLVLNVSLSPQIASPVPRDMSTPTTVLIGLAVSAGARLELKNNIRRLLVYGAPW